MASASEQSMELRKLLCLPSSHGFDDASSPFSASDLRDLMNKMHMRSEQFKDRVRHCAQSQHQEFGLIISRANDASVEFDKISSDLDSLLNRFDAVVPTQIGKDDLQTETLGTETPSFYVELRELVQETLNAGKEAKEKQRALEVVECISLLHDKLARASKHIGNREFLEGADYLMDVKNALGLSKDYEEESVSIAEEARPYTYLRQIWARNFSQISSSLQELFSKAVVLDAKDAKLYVHSFLTEEEGESYKRIALTTILTAMDKIGVLEEALAKFADTLLKTVINCILHEPLIVHVFEEQDATGKAVLFWSSGSTLEDGMILAFLYEKLLKVLNFLQHHLCCTYDPWTKTLGRFVWPRIADAIISGYLSKAVPNEVSELARFENLAALTNEFETALSELNFILKLDSDGDRLGKFASDVELHFALKKKSRLLARTRRLLVRFDFNLFSRKKTMEQISKEIYKVSKENSAELLFQHESCPVSQPAKQLMQIVLEVLQDACVASSRISLELYHAARDALLLYSAIVPVKLAKELNSFSHEAIIYHNDCLYLAHETLGLPYQYREALPENLREIVVFVDLVPLFQGMADDALGQQLHMIRSSLDQALDHGNGFQNTNNIQAFEMSSLAIDQVVFELEKVYMIWQPLMAHSIYAKSLGSLMTSVFGQLASEILKLDDMDVNETEQLRKLIFSLEERLFPMLQSLVSDADGKQNRTDGKSLNPLNQIGELVPTWCKLLRLAELLDMSLIPITQAWESGNLVVCGFSSFEIQKLIKAVFSDTDLRKESLQRIEAKQFSTDERGS